VQKKILASCCLLVVELSLSEIESAQHKLLRGEVDAIK
jgi:hypothetical protein